MGNLGPVWPKIMQPNVMLPKIGKFYCSFREFKFTCTKFWNRSETWYWEYWPKIATDEIVKMSKRKLLSYKGAVEEVLQFVEEGDENLENADDLEELFPENQIYFQLQPGKTKIKL